MVSSVSFLQDGALTPTDALDRQSPVKRVDTILPVVLFSLLFSEPLLSFFLVPQATVKTLSPLAPLFFPVIALSLFLY